MTMTDINNAFMLHRKNCKVCASDGLGLCWVGVKLMRLFHDVLVEEIVKDGPSKPPSQNGPAMSEGATNGN